MLDIEVHGGSEIRKLRSPSVPRKDDYIHFDEGRECYQVREIYYDVQPDGTCLVRAYAEQIAPVR